MAMLTLKLFPIEFAGMAQHLYWATQAQSGLNPKQQYLGDLVLLEYKASWKTERMLKWKARTPKKQFRLSLKLSVAKALYESLIVQDQLSDIEQLFLQALDQALVNYQPPYATTTSPYQLEAYY